MDSTALQVLLPLAAGAGAAASPYVARGIGPALSVWGATQAQGNQKYRNQLMQSQAEQEQLRTQQMQEEQAAKASAAQQIERGLTEGTPIPGTPAAVSRGYSPEQGTTLAEAMGVQPVNPNEPPVPQDYPAGALVLDPVTASRVRGTARINPLAALTLAGQAEAQTALPSTPPVAGPGQTLKGHLRSGQEYTVTGRQEPANAEQIILDPSSPRDRVTAAWDYLERTKKADAFQLYLDTEKAAGRKPSYDGYLEKQAAAGLRAKEAVEGWQPTPEQSHHAERAATLGATIRPPADAEDPRPYVDPTLYEQIYQEQIEKFRTQGKVRAGGAAPQAAGHGAKAGWITKDGKLIWNGKKWVPNTAPAR